jgi:hypothetical protein
VRILTENDSRIPADQLKQLNTIDSESNKCGFYAKKYITCKRIQVKWPNAHKGKVEKILQQKDVSGSMLLRFERNNMKKPSKNMTCSPWCLALRQSSNLQRLH